MLEPHTAALSPFAQAIPENSCTLAPGEIDNNIHLREAFVQQTCGCTKANGKPCSTLFPVEHYIEDCSQASLLTTRELDLVLLSNQRSIILQYS